MDTVAEAHPPHKSSPVASRAWFWVPTLYWTEGLPYAMVVTVSVILYKELGFSNAQIAICHGSSSLSGPRSWIY
jgi:PAT family beta-lactamase induction signal transducer AmpG